MNKCQQRLGRFRKEGFLTKTFLTGSGSPGLVVMGDDSCLKGCGFESERCILVDILTFFTLICCKNCIVCLKRPKITEKRPGLVHFFSKNTFLTVYNLRISQKRSGYLLTCFTQANCTINLFLSLLGVIKSLYYGGW